LNENGRSSAEEMGKRVLFKQKNWVSLMLGWSKKPNTIFKLFNNKNQLFKPKISEVSMKKQGF
jgi:hypothetical protein